MTFNGGRGPVEGPATIAINTTGVPFPFGGVVLYDIGPGLFPIIAGNSFTRVMQPIDNAYFSNNVFRETMLRYDGGRTQFEKSNQVIDCYLVIGKQAKRNSPEVRRLLRDFHWKSVSDLRDLPSRSQSLVH